MKDILFFFASSWDATNGETRGLWRSDGTEVGTRLVKNVLAKDLTDLNGTLFFVGSDSALTPWLLWRSDGTEAGTVPVTEAAIHPHSPVRVNGTLFFLAWEESRGLALWKSDGTSSGTVVVKDRILGTVGSSLAVLTAANDTLFFSGWNEINGWELWKSDGTPQGTTMVKDIWPGPSDSQIQELVSVGDRVFFQAHDGIAGAELWESDGSEAGTRLVEDLALGPRYSFPNNLAPVGSRLFFAANDHIVGNELWALDLGPKLTPWPGTATEDVCRKTVAEVVVTLSSASSNPVTVEYTTSDGTASAGEDYVPISGTLDFPPGITSRVIRVPVRSDRVLESDEYFNVTLTGVEGGVLDETASSAAVWIEDRPQPVICR